MRLLVKPPTRFGGSFLTISDVHMQSKKRQICGDGFVSTSGLLYTEGHMVMGFQI
jgi:hypothetical protein